MDILDRALESRTVDVEALLHHIQQIQDRVKLPPLTEEVLREAKAEGRL